MAVWRSPNYTYSRYFILISNGFIVGLFFCNLDDSRMSAQSRLFIANAILILPFALASPIAEMFHDVRIIFSHERLANMYSSFVFAAGLGLAELPWSVFWTTLYFVPSWFLPGLPSTPPQAGYAFLIMLVSVFFYVSRSSSGGSVCAR